MAEAPLKKMAQKRKCSLTRIGGAWIAKLPDNGMAQCNLCATDFSISCGGRTDVRRHQESARHAKLVKSKGLYEGWDGLVAGKTMFAYWIAHHNLPTFRPPMLEYNIEHSAAK